MKVTVHGMLLWLLAQTPGPFVISFWVVPEWQQEAEPIGPPPAPREPPAHLHPDSPCQGPQNPRSADGASKCIGNAPTHFPSHALGFQEVHSSQGLWRKCGVGLPSFALNSFILRIFVENVLSIRQHSERLKQRPLWLGQTENKK